MYKWISVGLSKLSPVIQKIGAYEVFHMKNNLVHVFRRGRAYTAIIRKTPRLLKVEHSFYISEEVSLSQQL